MVSLPLGLRNRRQTIVVFVLVLCFGFNIYIVSQKTTVRTGTPMVEDDRNPTDVIGNLTTNSSLQTGSAQTPCNSTSQLAQENLKLSLEITMKLSKILSDTLEQDRIVSDVEKLAGELKKLRGKMETLDVERTGLDQPSNKLLTLFTTMDETNTQRSLIYNNTIRNWASLRPMVRPVLFTNNDTFKTRVLEDGWETLPLERTDVGGMPILKYMYLSVLEKFKSDFYAFSNSDILFNGGLLKTVVTAKYTYDLRKPILVTGTRYNVQNVTDIEARERSNLKKIAKERGELFLPWAADYFITTSSFPWKDIPDLIIGALAYDNWLILHAREKKFLVIDATKTAPAVHQTPAGGNFESHFKVHSLHNYNVLSKTFPNATIDYEKGQVVCTEIVSSLVNENIIFEKRAESMPYCYF